MKSIDRFAVIGDPIAHSLSPVMQRAAFDAAGIEAVYQAEHVRPSELSTWVDTARARAFTGFNVTIPHKESIGPLLDGLDDTARRLGAVNTVVNGSAGFVGYNTDLTGFRAIVRSLDVPLSGRPVVVLGAGGSAAAITLALSDLGARITICNRHPEKARALAARLSITVTTAELFGPAAQRAVEDGELIVNTTPLGMKHMPVSPISDATGLQPGTSVIDLVYGSTTPLIARARTAGCRTVDGIEMLVQQGAASFELWTGVTPDLEIMRAACRRSLQEVEACSVS